VLHGQFAPEQLVRPPGTPWSNISGTHFHIAAERLVNFSGIPTLVHIFIDYCEHLQSRKFTIEDLKGIVNKNPNIEHILSQTPKFAPRSLGFRNTEDFYEYEHKIGNLTILERSYNSNVQNKSAIDKIDTYGKSTFKMTKKAASEIDTQKGFLKQQVELRTIEIAEYCLKRWWC
jgi:hypothetical protein